MNEIKKADTTVTKPPSEQYLESLNKIFPGVVQDGVLDAARLGELLNVEVSGLRDGKERYGLMWAGRQRAASGLHQPSYGALVPDEKLSLNWDSARNVLIQGDNYEVLKLLRRAYSSTAKLIYIDPPYNTGNDFVYNDDFSQPLAHYLEVTGQIDASGNKLVANTETSGRLHSNWLSMMFPRVTLAHQLLTDDGSIFISIDDNEVVALKALMDDIFGEENFIGSVAVKMSHLSGVKMSHIGSKLPKIKEWLIIYAKDKSKFNINPVYEPCTWDEAFDRYSSWLDFDDRNDVSSWRRVGLNEHLKAIELSLRERYKLENADRIFRTAVNDSLSNTPKDKIFRKVLTTTGLERVAYQGEEVVFASSKVRIIDGKKTPAKALGDIWTDIGINNLHNEGGVEFQNGKKPLKLIQRILELAAGADDLVIDFFAGSGTTGHAVELENAAKGLNRRYLLVNLPEELDSKSKQFELGDKTVADISRRRLTLNTPESSGFRYFRLGPSSFERQGMLDPANPQLLSTTLIESAEEKLILWEILLSLGYALNQNPLPLDFGDLNGFFIDGCWIVLGGNLRNDLMNALRDDRCTTLVVLEDLFIGLDALRAELWLESKPLGKIFRTF